MTEKQILKTLLNSKTANLSKWGDYNILYITGLSGSGKTTLASVLSDNIINLDTFFEQDGNKNPAFETFLRENFPEYIRLQDINQIETPDEAFELFDCFTQQIEDFAQKINQKIIVEGIQIADEVLYRDKKFFKNKPVIILQTSSLKSFLRCIKRDKKKLIKMLKSIGEYADWDHCMKNYLDTLSEITDAKYPSQTDIHNLYHRNAN